MGSVLLTEVGPTRGAPGTLVSVEVEPPAVDVTGVEVWLALLLVGEVLPARLPAAGPLARAGGGAGVSAGWNTGDAGTAALTYAGATGTTGVASFATTTGAGGWACARAAADAWWAGR